MIWMASVGTIPNSMPDYAGFRNAPTLRPFLLKHADDSGARQDMQVMHDDDQLVDPDLQPPPACLFGLSRKGSLSWEAKALERPGAIETVAWEPP